jgi:hypothetical protein
MRSGSRCSPFTPFNAFHGRRYRRLRALSFLLKADPWHVMTGAKAPRPRPGHRSVLPLPFRSAPARHRPCKEPVGSPLGPGRFPAGPWPPFPTGVSQGPAGSRPTWREPVRCPPAASRPHAVPSALRPAGRARAGAPSCPSPGVLPTPHEVPARALSRCPLSRQASALPFPVLRMYEGRTPDSPTTFLQVFSRIFPSPPGLVFPHVDDATVAS